MALSPAVIDRGEPFIDSLFDRMNKELRGMPFRHTDNPYSLFPSFQKRDDSVSHRSLITIVSGRAECKLNSSQLFQEITRYEEWWNGNETSLKDPESFASRKKVLLEILEKAEGKEEQELLAFIQRGEHLAAGLRESLGLYNNQLSGLEKAFRYSERVFLPNPQVQALQCLDTPKAQAFREAGEGVLENYFKMRQYENELLGKVFSVAHKKPRIGGLAEVVGVVSMLAVGFFTVHQVNSFLKGEISSEKIQDFAFSIALIPLGFGEAFALEGLRSLLS